MGQTRFTRVPFETTEAPASGALIRVFARKGKPVAQVIRYEWFEPDGHEHTGYADVTESIARPAAEVLAEFKKVGGQVAFYGDPSRFLELDLAGVFVLPQAFERRMPDQSVRRDLGVFNLCQEPRFDPPRHTHLRARHA